MTHLETTVAIVTAYVSHNAIPASELVPLLHAVHARINACKTGETESPMPHATQREPAVPIKKSIMPDHLICLDDGLKFKSLKRHLGKLGMTPDQYRAKWGLPKDYPMVAPNYSEMRSTIAKATGLGNGAHVALEKVKE